MFACGRLFRRAFWPSGLDAKEAPDFQVTLGAYQGALRSLRLDQYPSATHHSSAFEKYTTVSGALKLYEVDFTP